MADLYGLICFDSTGNIILNSNDRITRVLYSEEVAADSTGSVVINDLPVNENRYFAYAVALEYENGKLAHDVEVNGNVLSWTPNNLTVTLLGDDYDVFVSSKSLITVLGW